MTIKLAGLNGKTVDVPADVLQSFKAAFKGQLLTPDDAGFEESRKICNAMIDRRPGLIARCTGTVDVVQAVRFARHNGLLSSVRGGGHNIAGLAVCAGGLMIDMSAIVKTIAKRCGARIGLDTSALGGLRVRVRFPVAVSTIERA